MPDRIVPGNPKALTSADLLAALVNLIVAGPGITATFNPSTVQWTISVSASGSIGTAIIGSTFIVG